MSTTQIAAERILIVDDDPLVSYGLSLLLEPTKTEIATTCSEALARTDSFRPDALLIDIGLPDGDGVGLYRAITARHKTALPVVFCSGHAEESDLGDLYGKSGVAFLKKPFSAAALFAALTATTQAQQVR